MAGSLRKAHEGNLRRLHDLRSSGQIDGIYIHPFLHHLQEDLAEASAIHQMSRTTAPKQAET